MLVCRVVGRAVASIKDARLGGYRFLLCETETGGLLLAVDAVGAGPGSLVMVVQGSAAGRALPGNPPVDATVVAIIDELNRTSEG